MSRCGAERLCGSPECQSCFPGNTYEADEREADKARTVKELMVDLGATVAAIKAVSLREQERLTVVGLAGRAVTLFDELSDAVDREREESEADFETVLLHWRDIARKSEAKVKELEQVAYVHRPVGVSE